MNRTEKEQYVIRLYNENKSTREIAKLMHMSFRDIGAIIKKVKSQADEERGQLEQDEDIKSKSKTTQAISLFSETSSHDTHSFVIFSSERKTIALIVSFSGRWSASRDHFLTLRLHYSSSFFCS